MLSPLAEADKANKMESPTTSTGRVGPVVVFALIACIGGVLGGYSHGFPSPTLLQLEIAYRGGDRVTAFSSKSIYEGLFGVSALEVKPAPPICMLQHLQRDILIILVTYLFIFYRLLVQLVVCLEAPSQVLCQIALVALRLWS